MPGSVRAAVINGGAEAHDGRPIAGKFTLSADMEVTGCTVYTTPFDGGISAGTRIGVCSDLTGLTAIPWLGSGLLASSVAQGKNPATVTFDKPVLLRAGVTYCVTADNDGLVSDATTTSGVIATNDNYLAGHPFAVQSNAYRMPFQLIGYSPAFIRGQSIAFVNNASSVNVPLPPGTEVDNVLVLATGHGWVPSTPSGWTVKDSQNGSNVNGAVYTKVATAGDISAGSVTVNFSSTYYGEVVLVAVGNVGGIREVKMLRSGSGSGTVSVTTVGAASVDDVALYLGYNRGSNSATTFNRGTLLDSRTADTEAAAGAASEVISAAGTVTAQVLHSVPGTGYYDGIVLIASAAGAVTTGTSPVGVSSSSASAYEGVRVSGVSPVSVGSSSRSPNDLTAYTDGDNAVEIPLELSGIMDPVHPPPTPPVDFDGLPDPTVAPTAVASTTSGGHLAPGTYRYSYAAWKGDKAQATAPSPTVDITITTENTVTLTYPTIDGADGYLVYREDL